MKVYDSPRAGRVFPQETVRIQSFRLQHELDARNLSLHTGLFADALAVYPAALAVTLAADIYLRSGAFNPPEEDNRRFPARELSHAARYTENHVPQAAEHSPWPAAAGELRETSEAPQAEEWAVYEDDPLVTIEAGGEYFRIRRSRMICAAKTIAADISSWLRDQKDSLDEAEYLSLLCSLEKFQKANSGDE
jgi:hypothetical protein